MSQEYKKKGYVIKLVSSGKETYIVDIDSETVPNDEWEEIKEKDNHIVSLNTNELGLSNITTRSAQMEKKAQALSNRLAIYKEGKTVFAPKTGQAKTGQAKTGQALLPLSVPPSSVQPSVQPSTQPSVPPLVPTSVPPLVPTSVPPLVPTSAPPLVPTSVPPLVPLSYQPSSSQPSSVEPPPKPPKKNNNNKEKEFDEKQNEEVDEKQNEEVDEKQIEEVDGGKNSYKKRKSLKKMKSKKYRGGYRIRKSSKKYRK